MKKRYYTILLFFFWSLSWLPFAQAQFFVATFDKENNDLVFKITPNTGGGDITTGWSDIEFFVRYPDGQAGTFSFGSISINNTDFPGINIPNNGTDAQGSETGFENNWFGTSFSATAARLYEEGMEYEVFRVTISIDPAMVNFELVHNEFFSPTYLALTSQSGGDLTNNGGNKFYGDSPETCNTCPGPSNNDILPLAGAPAPISLVHFSVEKEKEMDANVKWLTESEVNSEYFDLERLVNGQWEKVSRIAAAGFSHSPQHYQFLDKNLRPYLSKDRWMYYRLKMVDLDGTFAYSSIKGIAFDHAGQWRVYPNPITPGQELWLQLENIHAKKAVRYQLFNLAGERIDQWQTENSVEISQHRLVSTLPAGVYLLQANVEGEVFTQRLVLQH